jgi:hypothetical protein
MFCRKRGKGEGNESKIFPSLISLERRKMRGKRIGSADVPEKSIPSRTRHKPAMLSHLPLVFVYRSINPDSPVIVSFRLVLESRSAQSSNPGIHLDGLPCHRLGRSVIILLVLTIHSSSSQSQRASA